MFSAETWVRHLVTGRTRGRGVQSVLHGTAPQKMGCFLHISVSIIVECAKGGGGLKSREISVYAFPLTKEA